MLPFQPALSFQGMLSFHWPETDEQVDDAVHAPPRLLLGTAVAGVSAFA